MDRAPQYLEKLMDALDSGLRERGITAKIEWDRIEGSRMYLVWVVSKAFANIPHSMRQALVWRIADETLTYDKLLRLSMILTLTPTEAGER